MNRNKAIASTAITKAVSGATAGKYNKTNLKYFVLLGTLTKCLWGPIV